MMLRHGIRTLPAPGERNDSAIWLIGVSVVILSLAVALEIVTHMQSGLRPGDNAYGAMVYMGSVINGQVVFTTFIMIGFCVARYYRGMLDRVRRVTIENAAILFYYSVAQLLLGLVLVHGFPRIA